MAVIARLKYYQAVRQPGAAQDARQYDPPTMRKYTLTDRNYWSTRTGITHATGVRAG